MQGEEVHSIRLSISGVDSDRFGVPAFPDERPARVGKPPSSHVGWLPAAIMCKTPSCPCVGRAASAVELGKGAVKGNCQGW